MSIQNSCLFFEITTDFSSSVALTLLEQDPLFLQVALLLFTRAEILWQESVNLANLSEASLQGRWSPRVRAVELPSRR